MIRGDGSLGYLSRKTIHSSSCCHNNNGRVLNKKVLKCLWASKFDDIGLLIPATLSQVIMNVVKSMDIGLLKPTTLSQVIVEVVDVG